MNSSTPPSFDLPKDSLIDLAQQTLEFQYPEFIFDTSEYEITAWANTEKTLVRYRRIIRFTPLRKKEDNLTYDFEVNLTEQSISPFDSWGMDSFYIPTPEDQEKINFVIQAFGMPRMGFNNSIIEEVDMYRINIDNDLAFGHYFIDKASGQECMGSIEGSYAQMPDFPEPIDTDPLVEIHE
ncbi:hypothetical protein BFP72_09300 [Reichenbachiella sp. 5M10]|nr:hypothetical protein BFP72_09300 [Reichenbachiella sp. 5M10]